MESHNIFRNEMEGESNESFALYTRAILLTIDGLLEERVAGFDVTTSHNILDAQEHIFNAIKSLKKIG